jgi:uncharacterized membrane protein YheB (UPF0754 family)
MLLHNHSSLPLISWNEIAVLRYLTTYRHGRIGQSTLALIGPLCNGKELIQRYKSFGDEDLEEAVECALRNPAQAWEECDGGFEASSLLELGVNGKLTTSSSMTSSTTMVTTAHNEYVPLTDNINKLDGDDDNSPAKFPPLIEMPSIKTASIIFIIILGIVLCVTVFRDDLADASGEESGKDFAIKFLKLASIPIGTTIFTWAHVWLALWCTFYPLEFIGCWQIPGTNVGFPFGWRGIIPHKGREMARMACRMIKEKLLSVDEVFGRLDPVIMAEQMRPGIEKQMETTIETVALEEMPTIWKNLPDMIKREIVRQSAKDAPLAVQQIFKDLRPEIDDLLDLEHLVVEVLVTDLRLCVDVFIVCGHKELAFIRNAGAVMGGTLGIVQMCIWIFYSPWWLLPVIGAIAGAFTNYLALLMIFWPVEPVSCCCGAFLFHGRFLRRQREVSKAYSKMVARDVLKNYRIVAELLYGARKSRVDEIIRGNIRKLADQSLAPLKPFVVATGQEARVERMKERIAELINDGMNEVMMGADQYMYKAFDLERTLQTRMMKLPYADFEKLLHPVFQEEEPKLVLVGFVVGLLFGILQILFIA